MFLNHLQYPFDVFIIQYSVFIHTSEQGDLGYTKCWNCHLAYTEKKKRTTIISMPLDFNMVDYKRQNYPPNKRNEIKNEFRRSGSDTYHEWIFIFKFIMSCVIITNEKRKSYLTTLTNKTIKWHSPPFILKNKAKSPHKRSTIRHMQTNSFIHIHDIRHGSNRLLLDSEMCTQQQIEVRQFVFFI